MFDRIYESPQRVCVQTELKHITAAVTHIKHRFTVCCDTDEEEKLQLSGRLFDLDQNFAEGGKNTQALKKYIKRSLF